MPKRLLVVTTVSLTLRSFILPFARYLSTKGWEVHGAANGVTADRERLSDFARLHEIPWKRNPFAASNAAAFLAIRRILSTCEFDLVHVHTPVAALLTRLAWASLGPRRKGKLVYTAHGFHFYNDARKQLNGGAYRLMERLMLYVTDCLIVINQEDRAAATNLVGGGKTKIWQMNGVGVDLSVYRRRAKDNDFKLALGVPDDAQVLLVVGELNENKRPQDVLFALRELQEDVHIIFAGDGPLLGTLKRDAQRLGLDRRVHFLGSRSDIPRLLGVADVLVLASRREGLPRCVMEAMAAELPVVATNIRGCRDLLEGGAGMLVEPCDPRALASAVDEILHDRELATRLADSAWQRIQAYDIAAVLAEQEAIYKSCLEAS